ncbi:hypothetical protein A1D22_05905 [Pasteurellaceae bacterium LFhippo2]|nr:hypothetical protein [Pasteurellaceae bacterium LFhippo2]
MRNVAELAKQTPVGSEPNYHHVPTKAVEITPQAYEVMDKLFQRLTLIFPAWRTSLPTDGSVAEFKAFWLEELINAKIRNWKLIARGLERCKQSKSPFLPSIGQFIEWCKAVDYHELGLPNEEQLLRKIYAFMVPGMENVNEFKFDSNAEYWLITGLYKRNRAGEWSEKKLKEELAKELAKMAKRIESGEQIPVPQLALEANPRKVLSREEQAKRWAEIRAKLYGSGYGK